MRRNWILMGLILLCLQSSGFSFPPIHFIENKNQWAPSIDYAAKLPGGNLFLQRGQFNFYFLDNRRLEELHEFSHQEFNEQGLSRSGADQISGSYLKVAFPGSSAEAEAVPFGKLSAYYNYFSGADPRKWASGAKAYQGILYPDFYPGIDLKVYAQGEHIKYDFIVEAGADPSCIITEYSGMDELTLTAGIVHVRTPFAAMQELQPVAFQWIGGKKVNVSCEFVLTGNLLSYRFPEGYDPCFELVIDPLLIFSTYSGSTADNWGSTATPGEHGTLYSSGVTNNLSFGGNFPATPGSFQVNYGGIYDVSILKYDSLGQQLLYASYLGGSDSESSHSLVMNANEELIVLGTTSSFDFPTSVNAFDRTFGGGVIEGNVILYPNGSDIFVARISADGTQLLSSTYLGGAANDGLNPSMNSLLVRNYGDQLRGDVITDKEGNILVSTVTSSADFPVSNSFGTAYRGGVTDGLILKLAPDLSEILWGAFIGGSATDASHTIKLDDAGTVYVGGGTTSADFPVTAGSYQSAHQGDADGWIAKIAGDGASIVAATFTGTAAFNQVYFLDLNSAGEVYVYGQTAGSFPVTAGVYSNPNSGQFIQKFSGDLSTLLFSTVFGSGRGIPDISPTAFLVNECNNLYMTGWGGVVNSATGHWKSNTIGMPVTNDAFQKTTSGSDFYFMALTADASEFLYGTYLGGTQSRTHVDGGTSRFDKSGVVYHAVCSGCRAFNAIGLPTSDFPTTPTAWSNENLSGNCNNAAFKFDLSSLKARIQTNNVALAMPGYNAVCLPDKIVFQNISTGGQEFYWDFGDGSKLVKSDTSMIIHEYKGIGKYTVRLKAVDAGTCKGKDSTLTVVNVYRPLGVVQDDDRICFGTQTQLQAGGGSSYEWRSEDYVIFSTEQRPVVKPPRDTTYFAAVTDVNGCVVKDTVDISVVPGIDVKFEWQKVHDCFSRPAVKVQNLTDPDEEVFFDFGDGTVSDQDQAVHHYEQDNTYAVRIVGTKEFCVYEKEEVIPFYTLKVPNVITPDQTPDKNDKLKIIYGDKTISEAGVHVSLIIYNRWGAKVYESSDYKDNWTGEGLAAGTYYYEATIASEGVTCKSWVQVIR